MDAVVLPVAWIVFGAGYAIAVMEPLYGRKPTVGSTTRFYLADYLWLLVLLQWPLVCLTIVRRWQGHQGGRTLLLGAVLVLLVVALWLGFASHLSTLRIRRSNRRGIFLVVVLPITIVGSLTIGPIAVLTTRALMSARGGFINAGGQRLLVVTLLVLVGGGFVGRRLNQWVARDADDLEE